MRMQMDVSGLNELIRELEKLEGSVNDAAKEALEATFDIVTAKAKAAAQKSNYPAGGKYSKGGTAKSLVETAQIYYHGTAAEVKVGFNIYEGGLQSIFMIYGTPRNMKVQAMYDAFYGKKTIDEVHKKQYEILFNAVRRLEG